MEPFDHDWWIRATCRAKYSHLESTSPTAQTIWCTIIIVIFTILLELFAHSERRSASWRNGPKVSPKPTSNEAPTLHSSDDVQPGFPQRMHKTEFDEQAFSIKIRKYLFLPTSTLSRLVVSTLLLLPVLAAFRIRMLDAITTPSLKEECIPVIHPVSPNWVIIWLLGIFPFISSCSAFVLVVCNAFLTWRVEKLGHEPRGERLSWPPGLPFAAVLLAVTALTAGLTLVAYFIMTAVLGLKERLEELVGGRRGQGETLPTTGDVEMHGEILESLMGKADIEMDDDDMIGSSGQIL